MSSTLTYGFVKPATGDKGSTFWGQLEDDLQQLNDHNHNGINSAKLSASSQEAVAQSVTSAGWANLSGGLYRQTVTLPATLTSVAGTYAKYNISFRNAADGSEMFLHKVQVTTTTFYVYCNDNTINLTVVYT